MHINSFIVAPIIKITLFLNSLHDFTYKYVDFCCSNPIFKIADFKHKISNISKTAGQIIKIQAFLKVLDNFTSELTIFKGLRPFWKFAFLALFQILQCCTKLWQTFWKFYSLCHFGTHWAYPCKKSAWLAFQFLQTLRTNMCHFFLFLLIQYPSSFASLTPQKKIPLIPREANSLRKLFFVHSSKFVHAT